MQAAQAADSDSEEEEEEPMNEYEYVLANFLGFDDDAERAIVLANSFRLLTDLAYVKEKDIRSMIEELGKRTAAQGRVIFGIGRMQQMIGLMHWVQDCVLRCDEPIDIVNIEFDTLQNAIEHAAAREAMKDSIDTQTKATTPGKFKKESEWHDWHNRFVNYLSTIPGMRGVPLSYVIRENEIPLDNVPYSSFIEKTIARAPLRGTSFVVDAQQVHSYLLGFVQGECAEQWIRHLHSKANGRLDVLALRSHYGGEGNLSRRLADADHLHKTLHYKSEKSFPFEKFLDRAQEMFNIYEENGQPMYDDQKTRWLLSKVQNTALASTIESIRVDKRRHRELSFVTAANDITAAISEFGEAKNTSNMSRNVFSANSANGRKGKSPHKARLPYKKPNVGPKGKYDNSKNDEGKLGYISPSDWKNLSFDARAKIREERDKKGFRGGNRTVPNSSNASALQTSSEERIISAISSAIKEASSSANSTVISQVTNDSGNAFGGRNEVHRQRQT
jgi:hypothetical protein